MRSLALLSIALTTVATASAQQLTVTALQPIVAGVQIGTSGLSSSLPAGALSSTGSIEHSAWPFASAELSWEAIATSTRMDFRLDLTLVVASQGTPSSASVVGTEFLLHLSNPTPMFARLDLAKLLGVAPGSTVPELRVDVGNDGSEELTENTLSQQTFVVVPIGPTPLPIRVQLAGMLAGTGMTESQVLIECRPASSGVLPLVAGCSGTGFTVQPTFANNLDYVSHPGFGNLAFAVFGLTQQPLLLPGLSGYPCLLIPSPDLVLMTAGSQHQTLVIPPAALPVQLWAQGVVLAGGTPRTTAGYTVALN